MFEIHLHLVSQPRAISACRAPPRPRPLTTEAMMASEAAARGLLAPEIAVGIGTVEGAKHTGVRAGNWLTREQAPMTLRVIESDENLS